MDSQEKTKDTNMVDIKDTRLDRFVLLKAERLSSGIHLVTGLMDKDEPIKIKLRGLSLGIISGLYDGAVVLDTVVQLTSLLDISLTGGLISEMNCSVLKKEYAGLASFLGGLKTSGRLESLTLTPRFVGAELDVALSTQPEPVSIGQSFLRDKSSMSFRKEGDKLSRQDLILKVFNSGKEYTINEIINQVSVMNTTSTIVDCSSKTIQRDLLRLVTTGAIGKKGERRWSRYFKKGEH